MFYKSNNFSTKIINSVYEKSGGRCWYCGKELTIGSRYGKINPSVFSIDHFTPRSEGGTDELENLVPACWSCNSSKGGKTLEEFRIVKKMQKDGRPRFTETQIGYLASIGFVFPELPEHHFFFEKINENN